MDTDRQAEKTGRKPGVMPIADTHEKSKTNEARRVWHMPSRLPDSLKPTTKQRDLSEHVMQHTL